MLKKVLFSTILGVTLLSNSVLAIEIHKECIMHPVLTGTDIKQNPYTKQEYEIMVYYDAVTGYRINTEVETIYMDNQDNRWYFPYDDDKFHKHEGIRMSFEKGYEEDK